MQLVTPRRGRPKGTGIDDADRIARLVELLKVKPELKPTTAIRLMGYSDPSAIRRLRDKYKIFAHSAAASAGLPRGMHTAAHGEAPVAIAPTHRLA